VTCPSRPRSRTHGQVTAGGPGLRRPWARHQGQLLAAAMWARHDGSYKQRLFGPATTAARCRSHPPGSGVTPRGIPRCGPVHAAGARSVQRFYLCHTPSPRTPLAHTAHHHPALYAQPSTPLVRCIPRHPPCFARARFGRACFACSPNARVLALLLALLAGRAFARRPRGWCTCSRVTTHVQPRDHPRAAA
jgi:hypothetical protein